MTFVAEPSYLQWLVVVVVVSLGFLLSAYLACEWDYLPGADSLFDLHTSIACLLGYIPITSFVDSLSVFLVIEPVIVFNFFFMLTLPSSVASFPFFVMLIISS